MREEIKKEYTISKSQLIIIANMLQSKHSKDNIANCELELYKEIKEALNLKESEGWM